MISFLRLTGNSLEEALDRAIAFRSFLRFVFVNLTLEDMILTPNNPGSLFVIAAGVPGSPVLISISLAPASLNPIATIPV